jgi:integrase/recombinase XerD
MTRILPPYFGMSVLHLQALPGHASLEMVQYYAQMIDDDLLDAHRKFSPVDNLKQLDSDSD